MRIQSIQTVTILTFSYASKTQFQVLSSYCNLQLVIQTENLTSTGKARQLLPKKLQNQETAQDPIVRKRSQTRLKCSYQQHLVNIPRSKASPVLPPEQHWARTSLVHHLLITHVASTANLAPARSSFIPKYTWWPRRRPPVLSNMKEKGAGHFCAPKESQNTPELDWTSPGLCWNGSLGKSKGTLKWKKNAHFHLSELAIVTINLNWQFHSDIVPESKLSEFKNLWTSRERREESGLWTKFLL